MKKVITLFVFLFYYCLIALSQNVTIKGNIIASSDGLPVKDVNISVKGNAVKNIDAVIDVVSDYNYRQLDGFLEINEKIVQKELKSIITVKELRQVYLGGELEIKKKYQKIELSSSMIIPYKEFLGATLNIEKKNRNTDSIRKRSY